MISREVTLETPVHELEIGVRLAHVIRYHCVDKETPTVGDLIDIPDNVLMQAPNFGRKSLGEWHAATAHLRERGQYHSILLQISHVHSLLSTLYSDLAEIERRRLKEQAND